MEEERRVAIVQYCTDVRPESLGIHLGIDFCIRYRGSLDGQGGVHEAVTFSTRLESAPKTVLRGRSCAIATNCRPERPRVTKVHSRLGHNLYDV